MLLDAIIIYLSITLSTILGLSDRSLNFSVDYFVGVETKYVCLLSCEKNKWYRNFAIRASSQNIATMSVNVNKRESLDLKMINLCLNRPYTPIGILISPKCSTFEDIVYYASENSLFDATHKWLIIDNEIEFNDDSSAVVNTDRNVENFNDDDEKENISNFNTTMIKSLSNVNLSIDADITITITKDSRKYDLYEVFNFGKIRGGKFVIQKIGNWDEEKGLNVTKIFKYYRRWNFQRMTLKMIVTMNTLGKPFDPEMIMGRVPAPGVPVITQTGAQVLEEVASLHNIRYNYTIVDRWVGDYQREHLYTVTNGLYFREHDITPVLRFLRGHFSRYDVLFPPVTFIETRYYYRIPSYGIGKFENQFLRPLSTAAWWCVVAMAILCGIMLALSAIVEKRSTTIDFAFFSVLALICQQFFEEFEDMRRISSGERNYFPLLRFLAICSVYLVLSCYQLARKLTIFVTGLSCLLIYNYYTSSVVSWLLNGPPPSINSLHELLDSPLQPIFQDTGYSYSWLQLPDYYYNKKNTKAEDELKKRLLDMRKKGKNIFKSVSDGIDLVRQGGYVYHTDTTGANKRISERFTQRELCDLDSLKSMPKYLLYPCVQKNSPYRQFYIWSLSRLQERGIIRCIQLRTWSQGLKCEGSSPRALALGGAAPAFILLAMGYIFGTIVMLLERLKWKYETARLKPFQRRTLST